MEDDCVSYIVGDEFGTQSVWFTRGKFSSTQYGGILKSDVDKKIIDIRVVPKYQEEFSEYKKLTGLMRVGKNEIDYFKDLISRYCKTTLNQYYLRAWIRNLTRLPAIESDISAFEFATFNSPEDYDALLKSDILSEQYSNDRVELIEVKKLKHIEGHSSARVELIKDRICAAGFWLRPIYVEKNYFLVLDGQHRMEAAKLLGLKYIPAQLFDYNEVEVWSLRAEEAVARDIVIERARSGDIYPYKTVKHRFENQVTKIKFSLNDLKV
jgi:hypothetical protein